MAQGSGSGGFGRSQTFRLDKGPAGGESSFWDRFSMENISKKYLIIGCAVFFFACMIIILVALSVTIATHRKFYYAFMPSEETTSSSGGEVSPEEEKTTDIPCPLQDAKCGEYGCRLVEDSATGTSQCFLREDAFGYKYRHTTYGDREVNFSLSYDISRKSPFMNQVINNVKVQVVYVTEEILRVRIHDEDRPRYEVPVSTLWTIPRILPPINKDQLAYTVEANQTKKGYARIRILRTDNEIAMLDSWYPIMTEQFLQIVLPYSGQQIYGFGENGHDGIMLGTGSGTMFSRHGSNHTKTWNSFAGVHPFFMNPKGDGTTWGVLLVNSNAIDYTVTGTGSIALATIGGIMDLYFFVGSTPNHVIQLYHKVIGNTFLPPFWALGYQHWLQRMPTLASLKVAVNVLDQGGVPKDALWLDVSQDSRAFTLSPNFNGLATYVQQLANSGVQVGLILNPAIAADNRTAYVPYRTGVAADVFVRQGNNPPVSNTNAVLLAKGLPSGLSAFPDFFKNRTRVWWRNLLEDYQGNVTEFSGLFLDVNEPAEFSADQTCQPGDASCQIQVCPQSRWEDPPYLPFAFRESENRTKLHDGTLCMSAGMGERQELPHYDVHSVYGWRQSWTTKTAMDDISVDRSIVLSDSTYPSSGRFAGHVLDLPDAQEWSSLRRAIVGVLEFNMFGIPYVGGPICMAGVPELLCQRWTELGAFFPLSVDYRMHDANVQADRMTPIALNAIRTRYHFLALLYTLFFRSHMDGGAVVRPVFFEFPLDRATYDIDDQFMWGSVVLFSPVLEENATKHTYYLPLDTWFEYPEGKRVEGSVDPMSRDVTENTTVLIHVRAGQVVPVQPMLRLTQERAQVPFDLYVYPKNGFASGELFVDDGVSQGTIETNQYDLYSFVQAQDLLRISVSHVGSGGRQNSTIKNVVFFDTPEPPARVSLNRNFLHQDSIKHDAVKKTLTVVISLQLRTLNSLGTEAIVQVEKRVT
ncbi:unnamed protein product [Ixodes hexagonus]